MVNCMKTSVTWSVTLKFLFGDKLVDDVVHSGANLGEWVILDFTGADGGNIPPKLSFGYGGFSILVSPVIIVFV